MKLTPTKKSTAKSIIRPAPVEVVNEDDDDFFCKKKKPPSPFTQQLPAERVWPRAAIGEKATDFLIWLDECQSLVDRHFGMGVYRLLAKPITNYLWITMQSKTDIRVFAFVAKATGDIHCPALYDEPLTASHGNVRDALTRLSIMGAWGVTTQWSWLPTYPENQRFSKKR